MSQSIVSKGYEYIQGAQDQSCYERIQNSCGQCIGFLKAWLPCIGCFCICYQHPYIQIQQGQKGLLLKFEKYIRTLQPGLVYVNPITQKIINVDCRIEVIDLPKQRLITKDYMIISIDSCSYFHLQNPHLAMFRMQDLKGCVAKVCGGIIKNTVSHYTFQQLLQKRQQISNDIETQIKPITKHWGVQIDQIFLKDFGISLQLERQLVAVPVTRREVQGTIINAQAEVKLAELLSNKSDILNTKTAMQVRYLQTLKSLAYNPQSKLIYNSY